MAFFEKDKSVPVDRKFLSYSYPETILFNQGQWEKKNLTGANYYYKITYPIGTGSNGAKLVYANQGVPSTYTPTYMYIFSLLHNNISGITDDDPTIIGELVIEHKNNSNDNKLFLCILLKGQDSAYGGKNSTIDNIITMIESDQTSTSVTDTGVTNKYKNSCEMLLDKQDIKKNQKCFIYKDTISPNNTVIVFTVPIQLGDASISNLISKFENTTNLFSISAPTNYESETRGATNSSSETSDNTILGRQVVDDIYIDCQPTGSSLEDIATYNIPLASALSNDMQKIDYMKTSVNFFLFCLGLILVYMGVPMLYKMLVIDKVNNNVEGGDLQKKKTIRGADILICGFAVFYVLSCFFYGFKSDGDITLIVNGLFGFVILGISVSLILIKKLDSEFLRTGDNKIKYEEGEEKTESFTDANITMGILGAAIAFLFSTKGALLHIVSVNVIFLIILLILRYGTRAIPDDKTFGEYFKRYCLFYLPLSVALFIFLSKP